MESPCVLAAGRRIPDLVGYESPIKFPDTDVCPRGVEVVSRILWPQTAF